MPAQFSKDQRVFLVLEYRKRRGRKGVQNEITQEFNYKFHGVRSPIKKPNFCGFFVTSHSIFDEFSKNVLKI